MKSTNALVAAALAGVFAAGTTLSNAAQSLGTPLPAAAEKDKCDGKDSCPGKDKQKKEEGTSTLSTSVTEMEKDKCTGKDKDKCTGKDKDKCTGKDKMKGGEIL